MLVVEVRIAVQTLEVLTVLAPLQQHRDTHIRTIQKGG
jgi:hypothetical protein